MSEECATEPKNITKRLGKVTVNDKVCLSVKGGKILPVLDRNGSGKATLMNVISGICYPNEGQISVNGEEAIIHSSRGSSALGIGMIHRHFKLVGVLVTAESIILGLSGRETLDIKAVSVKINELTVRYGLELDPDQKIYTTSVSQKQTVETVKLLYRGMDILILDEPTVVLTSQEADKLSAVLRNIREAGHSVTTITHKLHEVLVLSDRVSVLRKGQYISTVYTTNATEESPTGMMVDKKVSLNIKRLGPANQERRLMVEGVTCTNKEGVTTLDHASFAAYSEEILGIAGIAGSGQRELLESIAGLQSITGDTVTYYPPEGGEKRLSGMSASTINKLGVKLFSMPKDRLGMGLVGAMGMMDNMMFRGYCRGRSVFTDRKTPKSLAKQIIEELKIVTPSATVPVHKLSGDNIQKVLVGGGISSNPKVLTVTYPVRGLDISSSYTTYHLLNERKRRGAAATCVSKDPDVPLKPYDRTLMLYVGRVSGVVNGRTATEEQAGLMVTRAGDSLNE